MTITQQELEARLWGAANALRGPVDPADFKTYVFPMLSDQGLLVPWGGITKEARRSIASDRLTMRVWDADEVLDQLFDVYELLPEGMRARIPMKRAWVLDEETR